MEEKILNYSATAIENRENGSFAIFLRILKRFLALIIILTVIGTAVGLGVAVVREKTVYGKSKSVMFIAKRNSESVSTNISLTNKFLDTVKQDITTPLFIAKANEEYKTYCENNGKTDQLKKYGGLSAKSVSVKTGNSMIITVTYNDYHADAAQDKLEALIKSSKIQLQTPGLITADNVDLVPIQNVPTTTVSNGFIKYVLIGFFGGLIVGVLLALLFYLLDNTVSSKEDLERLTGVEVLGYIDDVKRK